MAEDAPKSKSSPNEGNSSTAPYPLKWRIAAHQNSITSLSSAANCVLTGSSDGAVRLWKGEDGDLGGELKVTEMCASLPAVYYVGFGKQVIVAVVRTDEETALWSWPKPAGF